MTKYGLLKQFGRCQCDDSLVESVTHIEIEYDTDGSISKTFPVEDYQCKKCDGVVFGYEVKEDEIEQT